MKIGWENCLGDGDGGEPEALVVVELLVSKDGGHGGGFTE